MDNAKIKALKKAILEFMKGDKKGFDDFWTSKHPWLGNKSPEEMVKTPEGFRKLEIMVTFSLKGCE